jgi:hypothetical protein
MRYMLGIDGGNDVELSISLIVEFTRVAGGEVLT